MIWGLITIVFLIIAIAGFIGVQKTGNYENKWGFILIWGSLAFMVSLILKAAVVIGLLITATM